MQEAFHAISQKIVNVGGLALSCLAADKFARGTCKVPTYGNSEEENSPAPCEKSNGKIC